MPAGTLYRVPSSPGAAAPARLMPEAAIAVLHGLRHFVVEDAKTARHFLKEAGYPHPLHEL